MPTLIYLRNRETGECAIYRQNGCYMDPLISPPWMNQPPQYQTEEEALMLVDYMFADGNEGCDCNRERFLDDALGREEGDYQCSEGRIAVDCVIDEASGKVLYRDKD